TEVRPEVLVRRADQDVDAPVRDVDRAVRSEMDRVCPRERARVVGELHDPPYVRDRADGVRSDREGDDARAVAQLRLEVVEVERRVVVDLDELDVQLLVAGEIAPWRDVAVATAL